MKQTLQVWVDPEVCVGSAVCTELLPAVFELDPQRQAGVVRNFQPNLERVLRAAQACPVMAISIEGENGSERIFP